MRGGPAPMARGGPPVLPSNEATARTASHPAPYDGWNARGNLANMKPTEAIVLDNIFPGVQDVSIRKGCSDWAIDCPDTIHSLLAYSGMTVNKLFAATNSNIYDTSVDAACYLLLEDTSFLMTEDDVPLFFTSGVFGAPGESCTSGFWKSLNIATAGGNFLFAVNGADLAKTFDGTDWATPTITVADSSTWKNITLFKHRIWAVQRETMDLWYLDTDSIAGAATKFPVGALFKKGGYVVALGSWTIDSGAGSDDLFVIVTSNGQIAVYQGTDPSSSTTWALNGVYDVTQPIGDDPLIDYGGDLIYLSATGLVPLSSLVQSTTLNRSSLVSFNIDGAFLDATTNYSAVRGWEMVVNKKAGWLLVNIPISQDVLSYQYVMNTTTKAWCRFTGWNASCWAELAGDVYFASDTAVRLAWSGDTDAGAPISGLVGQAYSYLGSRQQKEVSLARVNIGLGGAAQIGLSLDSDFKAFDGQSTFTYSPAALAGVWDNVNWDDATWSGDLVAFDSKWTTIPGNPGYLHSLRLQITISSGSFVWVSTDFAWRGAGIL